MLQPFTREESKMKESIRKKRRWMKSGQYCREMGFKDIEAFSRHAAEGRRITWNSRVSERFSKLASEIGPEIRIIVSDKDLFHAHPCR